ncbi:MAG: ubiquinone biosynthesis protein UbiA [Chitinophagaceae bacterium]|nr:MAG: ubiquinone biosynthesis protein UbiA [Chitinophagaceae bacterium]
MKLLGAFLKLVRYPNLVYIFLTQYLLQYCVIIPVFHTYNVSPTLTDGWFFLLSLSTVLIAAAGYIINDYFDINIDQVNKPERIIIDRIISRRWAILWHTTFNVIGVALGFLIGWKAGNPLLGITQLFCSGLLWFYSTSYKRQLLIGNISISLLTALTVLVVGFFEPQLYSKINVSNAPAVYPLLRIILLYALFAFLISMIREIVKDLEDIKGDAWLRCRTMPIVYGVNASKDISYIISWILIGLIVFVQVIIFPHRWYITILYLLVLVQLPLLAVNRKLSKAVTPKDFHYVSNLIKLIMLTGIISMVFFIFYF